MKPITEIEHHINGQTVFNHLTIMERQAGPGRTMFRCRCGCGAEIIERGDKVASGARKSCGKCPLNPARPRSVVLSAGTRQVLLSEPCGCRPTSDPHKSHRVHQRPVPGPMAESLALAARRSGMRWNEIADLITPAGSPVACTVEDAKQAVDRAENRTGAKKGI